MMNELGVSPRGWDEGDTEPDSDDESSSENGAYHYGHDDDDDSNEDEDEDEYEDEDENAEGAPLMDEGGKDDSDAGDDMEEAGAHDEVLAEVMQAEEFQREGRGEMDIPLKMPAEAASSN